jgi:branched-chain amino acid aminotransferase
MQVVSAQKRAKDKGHSDVLYLDPVHKKFVEEVSSCNIFMVKVCMVDFVPFDFLCKCI